MDENDLRRQARKTGFDVATLEKDYALTWLLTVFTGMSQS
jgi:predicted nucleotidyltransferase component of viral defense system